MINSDKTIPDKDVNLIPPGSYCYEWLRSPMEGGQIISCPYWDRDLTKNEQDNGYCHFLKTGDWEGEGLNLLWDMVKECGERDMFTFENFDTTASRLETALWMETVLNHPVCSQNFTDERRKLVLEKIAELRSNA
jgi:hypothetical protein